MSEEYIITKRESTNLKIDMARDALLDERYRREQVGLATIRIPSVRKGRKLRFKKHYPIKCMDSAVRSNKYLCGLLSRLCDELKKYGLAYPWLDEAA